MPALEAVSPPSIQCQVVRQDQADKALSLISARLAGTKFVSAKASHVPGLIEVEMENGSSAFTDVTGTFCIVGAALDLRNLNGQVSGEAP